MEKQQLTDNGHQSAQPLPAGTVATALGLVDWRADGAAIELTFRGETVHARWDEITRGGLVRTGNAATESGVPSDVMNELGKGLPGLGRLMGINAQMAEDYRQLTLARGPSDRRMVRVPLPLDDTDARDLVRTVQSALGERWVGEISMANHYRALDVKRPWWSVPVSILFLVGLGYILVFACTGFTSLAEGNLNLPPVLWIGMVAWLLIIGGILWLYRRL